MRIDASEFQAMYATLSLFGVVDPIHKDKMGYFRMLDLLKKFQLDGNKFGSPVDLVQFITDNSTVVNNETTESVTSKS